MRGHCRRPPRDCARRARLIRLRVFDNRVGSVFHLNLRFPWLRVIWLNSSSLDLQLVTGRIVVVPLVWASCGVMGERLRLECALCGRRACTIYHLDGRVACRRCNGLWYAAQRTGSYGRKSMAKRKIRRKLGDHGQLWAAKFPPKPRGMWRRTYARHCAALDRIERTKLTPRVECPLILQERAAKADIVERSRASAAVEHAWRSHWRI